MAELVVTDPASRPATRLDGALRIALVGPLPPPAGGMANQTRQLARLLADEGIAVDLVQVNRPYAPAWVGGIRGVRAAFRLLPYLAALWRAAGRADVVHVMANSGWAWHLFAAPAIHIAALRGRPVVVNYRGGEAAAFLDRSAPLVRWTLRRARELVVPSGFLHGVFASHGVASVVVPNIVDLERFAPCELEPRAEGPRFVVTRNLEPIYDVGTALRAFARVVERHPGATLVVAGTGPERDALEALARSLGIRERVDFPGRLEPAEIAALHRSADALLNPALADNMPNSVLEALAAGVPVVSTDVGGVRHVVEHGRTALLVPPGDAEAMAGAAMRLLGDDALRERLRADGRAAAEQYGWPRVRPLWIGIYRRLAAAGCGTVRSS